MPPMALQPLNKLNYNIVYKDTETQRFHSQVGKILCVSASLYVKKELLLFYILEVLVSSHLQFVTSRLISNDDTMLVHLQG